MWTWVSESRNLSVYQDLSFLLRLTYGKLWNVESQRNEYIGKLYNTYKWRNVLSRFQIYPASFFLHTIDWLAWTKTQHLLKGNAVSWKGSPGSLKGAKHWKFTLLVFFFLFQQYLYNHHVTPASSITNLLLEEAKAYKRPRWKLRFCTDWKTI